VFSALAILEHLRQRELIEDAGEISDFMSFDPCTFGFILPCPYFEDLQADQKTRRLWQESAGWTAQDASLLHRLGNLFLSCGFIKKFDSMLGLCNPLEFFEQRKYTFRLSQHMFTCRDIGNSDLDVWTPEECRKRSGVSIGRLLLFLGENQPVSKFRFSQPEPIKREKNESVSWKDDIFIRAGLAGVKIVDKHGATPLHRATLEGDLEIMSALLDKGAHPEWRDSKGKTPLDYAIESGNVEATELLRKAEAKQNNQP